MKVTKSQAEGQGLRFKGLADANICYKKCQKKQQLSSYSVCAACFSIFCWMLEAMLDMEKSIAFFATMIFETNHVLAVVLLISTYFYLFSTRSTYYLLISYLYYLIFKLTFLLKISRYK